MVVIASLFRIFRRASGTANRTRSRSADFFRQKLNYIHQNPVRAGIVEKEGEFRFSSARDFYNRKGLLELSYYL